jgi:hypothetical protein
MAESICNFDGLSIGKSYRVVANTGYFDKVCIFRGFVPSGIRWAKLGHFMDDTGRKHLISSTDCDDTVTIYNI